MKPTSKVSRTELTPVSFLERSAYVFPEKVAVIHGERRYTYRQLEERVNRLGSALRRADVEFGRSPGPRRARLFQEYASRTRVGPRPRAGRLSPTAHAAR